MRLNSKMQHHAQLLKARINEQRASAAVHSSQAHFKRLADHSLILLNRNSRNANIFINSQNSSDALESQQVRPQTQMNGRYGSQARIQSKAFDKTRRLSRNFLLTQADGRSRAKSQARSRGVSTSMNFRESPSNSIFFGGFRQGSKLPIGRQQAKLERDIKMAQKFMDLEHSKVDVAFKAKMSDLHFRLPTQSDEKYGPSSSDAHLLSRKFATRQSPLSGRSRSAAGGEISSGADDGSRRETRGQSELSRKSVKSRKMDSRQGSRKHSTATAPRQQIFCRRKRTSNLSISQAIASKPITQPVLGHARSRSLARQRQADTAKTPVMLGAGPEGDPFRAGAMASQATTPPVGVSTQLNSKAVSRNSMKEARELWANATATVPGFQPMYQDEADQLISDAKNIIPSLPQAVSYRTPLPPAGGSQKSVTDGHGDSQSNLDQFNSSPMVTGSGQMKPMHMNLDLTEGSPVNALQPKLNTQGKGLEIGVPPLRSSPTKSDLIATQQRMPESAVNASVEGAPLDYHIQLGEVTYYNDEEQNAKKRLIASIKHDVREIKRILMTSNKSSKNTAAVDEEVRQTVPQSHRDLSRLTSSKERIQGHKTVNADYINSEVAEKASLIESLFLDQNRMPRAQLKGRLGTLRATTPLLVRTSVDAGPGTNKDRIKMTHSNSRLRRYRAPSVDARRMSLHARDAAPPSLATFVDSQLSIGGPKQQPVGAFNKILQVKGKQIPRGPDFEDFKEKMRKEYSKKSLQTYKPELYVPSPAPRSLIDSKGGNTQIINISSQVKESGSPVVNVETQADPSEPKQVEEGETVTAKSRERAAATPTVEYVSAFASAHMFEHIRLPHAQQRVLLDASKVGRRYLMDKPKDAADQTGMPPAKGTKQRRKPVKTSSTQQVRKVRVSKLQEILDHVDRKGSHGRGGSDWEDTSYKSKSPDLTAFQSQASMKVDASQLLKSQSNMSGTHIGSTKSVPTVQTMKETKASQSFKMPAAEEKDYKAAQAKINAAIKLLSQVKKTQKKVKRAVGDVKVTRNRAKRMKKKQNAAAKGKGLQRGAPPFRGLMGGLRRESRVRFERPQTGKTSLLTDSSIEYFHSSLYRPRKIYVSSERERQLSTLEFKHMGIKIREMTYNLERVLVDSKDSHVELKITDEYLPPTAPQEQIFAATNKVCLMRGYPSYFILHMNLRHVQADRCIKFPLIFSVLKQFDATQHVSKWLRKLRTIRRAETISRAFDTFRRKLFDCVVYLSTKHRLPSKDNCEAAIDFRERGTHFSFGTPDSMRYPTAQKDAKLRVYMAIQYGEPDHKAKTGDEAEPTRQLTRDNFVSDTLRSMPTLNQQTLDDATFEFNLLCQFTHNYTFAEIREIKKEKQEQEMITSNINARLGPRFQKKISEMNAFERQLYLVKRKKIIDQDLNDFYQCNHPGARRLQRLQQAKQALEKQKAEAREQWKPKIDVFDSLDGVQPKDLGPHKSPTESKERTQSVADINEKEDTVSRVSKQSEEPELVKPRGPLVDANRRAAGLTVLNKMTLNERRHLFGALADGSGLTREQQQRLIERILGQVQDKYQEQIKGRMSDKIREIYDARQKTDQSHQQHGEKTLRSSDERDMNASRINVGSIHLFSERVIREDDERSSMPNTVGGGSVAGRLSPRMARNDGRGRLAVPQPAGRKESLLRAAEKTGEEMANIYDKDSSEDSEDSEDSQQPDKAATKRRTMPLEFDNSMKNQVLRAIVRDVKKTTVQEDLGAQARARKQSIIEMKRQEYAADAQRWDIYREDRLKEQDKVIELVYLGARGRLLCALVRLHLTLKHLGIIHEDRVQQLYRKFKLRFLSHTVRNMLRRKVARYGATVDIRMRQTTRLALNFACHGVTWNKARMGSQRTILDTLEKYKTRQDIIARMKKTIAHVVFMQKKFRMTMKLKEERLQMLRFVFYRELTKMHAFYRNLSGVEKAKAQFMKKRNVEDDVKTAKEVRMLQKAQWHKHKKKLYGTKYGQIYRKVNAFFKAYCYRQYPELALERPSLDMELQKRQDELFSDSERPMSDGDAASGTKSEKSADERQQKHPMMHQMQRPPGTPSSMTGEPAGPDESDDPFLKDRKNADRSKRRAKYYEKAKSIVTTALRDLVERRTLDYAVRFMMWRNKAYLRRFLELRRAGDDKLQTVQTLRRHRTIVECLPESRQHLADMEARLFTGTEQVCEDHTFFVKKEDPDAASEKKNTRKRKTTNKKKKAQTPKYNSRLAEKFRAMQQQIDETIQANLDDLARQQQDLESAFAPFIFYVTQEEVHRVIYKCVQNYDEHRANIQIQRENFQDKFKAQFGLNLIQHQSQPALPGGGEGSLEELSPLHKMLSHLSDNMPQKAVGSKSNLSLAGSPDLEANGAKRRMTMAVPGGGSMGGLSLMGAAGLSGVKATERDALSDDE